MFPFSSRLTSRRTAAVDAAVLANFIDVCPVPDDHPGHLVERLHDVLERVDVNRLISHRRWHDCGDGEDVEMARLVVHAHRPEYPVTMNFLQMLGPALGTLEFNARVQNQWVPGRMEAEVSDVVEGRRTVESLIDETPDLTVVMVRLLWLSYRTPGRDFYLSSETGPLRSISAERLVVADADRAFAEDVVAVLAARFEELRAPVR